MRKNYAMKSKITALFLFAENERANSIGIFSNKIVFKLTDFNFKNYYFILNSSQVNKVKSRMWKKNKFEFT